MTVRRLVVPVVIAAVGVVPALLLWSGLPDQVAVHWDGGGDPNGHAGRWVGIGGPAAVAVVLAAVLAVQLRRVPPRFVTVMLLGCFGGVNAAIATTTALANRDVETWRDGDLSALGLVTQMLAVFAAGGAAVLALGDRWARPTRRATPPPPVRTGSRAAWSGTARGGWALAAAALLGGLTVLALVVAGLYLLGIVLALAEVALFVAIGSVQVTVGAHGLTARSPFGWPAVTIPLADIERVEVDAIDPMAWGGWGYRGSLRVTGRAAWIVRRGEGVVLHLADGHRFAVTVDDASAAAETLSDQIPMR